jgi:hypothetical protein
VHASVFEHKSRTCSQVFDGRRHEELARLSETCNSSADVHGEPADLPVDCLDFTGMRSCPDVEPERLDSFDDGSAAYRTARAGPSNVAKNPSPAVSISVPL